MMKIAFVCDWLTGMRGGEKCLKAMYGLHRFGIKLGLDIIKGDKIWLDDIYFENKKTGKLIGVTDKCIVQRMAEVCFLIGPPIAYIQPARLELVEPAG